MVASVRRGSIQRIPDLKLAKADQLAYDTARAHHAARAGPMDLEAGGQR